MGNNPGMIDPDGGWAFPKLGLFFKKLFTGSRTMGTAVANNQRLVPGAGTGVGFSTALSGVATAATINGAVSGSRSASEVNAGFQQANGGVQDPNALDPSTLNQNIFGQHYPGSNNPRTYSGRPDYSTSPVNLAGYPAIGHDRRYDNLEVAGAKGLFTDTRAIGADWRFVSEEFQMGNLAWQLWDISTALKAYALGIGLGAAALPKTIFQYAKPSHTGHIEVMMWYHISNHGVTNKPSK